MVGWVVLLGVMSRQWPSFGHSYLLDPPTWASRSSAKEGDPVFLTYVGGDAGLMPGAMSPNHLRAAQGIRSFVQWQDPYDVLYSRKTVIAEKEPSPKKPTPLRVVFRPRNLSHLKRLDTNGNTILNRLLMSHIVMEEKPMLQALLQLKTRGLVSMRSNRSGQTPLMFAVESGYPSLVDEILKLNPAIGQNDGKGNDIFEYMICCVDRPDNRYATSRVIYTSEGICDALLRKASPSEREVLIVRARFAMNYIRQRTSGTDIIP